MKTKFFIAAFIITFIGFSQNDFNVKNNDKRYVSFHALIGSFKAPTNGGVNSALNIQWSKAKALNFGVNLQSAHYVSPDYNRKPDNFQITNYDPETDAPYVEIVDYDDHRNRFQSLSIYLSKNFRITKGVYLDVQAGPSINYLRQKKFEYYYSPGFNGTFSGGGSPPSVRILSSERALVAAGLYLRASSQFKIAPRTVIELTPFSNINSEESVLGIQFGFVFGSHYKTILLN